MPIDDDQGAEATTRRGSQSPQPPVRAGHHLGMAWRVVQEGGHLALQLGNRSVHLMPDGIGSFVTHAMVGRWRDVEELARAILLYHPDYSPLARRGGPNV